MSPALAIIADDLTGALDTAAPFAAAGLRVRVAIAPHFLDDAVAAGPEVVAVSTNSRALAADAAAARVADVARRLVAAGTARFLKKVDSRLKGNVGAETAALARVVAAVRVIAAPAVPDQRRHVVAGRVTGRGVAEPIDVAAAFCGLGLTLSVPDAVSAADLDAIAARLAPGDLAVGARGLGIALARRLGRNGSAAPDLPVAGAATLLAIGSRDPITAAQIARLEAERGIPIHDAPAGVVPADVAALPAVVRCTGDGAKTDPAAVAERFADGIAAIIAATAPALLVTGGGDTALALLGRLDAGVIEPIGEVAPGMPLLSVDRRGGGRLACVVKSGGFGEDDVLSALFPAGFRHDGGRGALTVSDRLSSRHPTRA